MRRGSKEETFRASVVMAGLVSTTLSRNECHFLSPGFTMIWTKYFVIKQENHIWCTQTLYDQIFDAHALYDQRKKETLAFRFYQETSDQSFNGTHVKTIVSIRLNSLIQWLKYMWYNALKHPIILATRQLCKTMIERRKV